jgi:hypothetical protein
MSATPQSTILPFGQPVGFAGQVTHREDTQSAANKEATSNIGFGLGVKAGTNVKEALLPTASSSVLAGIVTNESVTAPGTFGGLDKDGSPPGLIPKTMMELLTEGRIWAEVDADVTITVNTGAYWRFESDGASNTKKGTFRNTDDGHVVDVRKKVTFKSGKFLAADQLTGGTQYIAEVYVSISNAQ